MAPYPADPGHLRTVQDNCEPLPKEKVLRFSLMSVAYGNQGAPVVFRYKELDPQAAYQLKVKSIGASPSTKYIFPMEFTGLLDSFMESRKK